MTDLIDCLRLVILIVAVISKKGVGGYWMDETGKGRGGGGDLRPVCRGCVGCCGGEKACCLFVRVGDGGLQQLYHRGWFRSVILLARACGACSAVCREGRVLLGWAGLSWAWLRAHTHSLALAMAVLYGFCRVG